LNPSSHRKISIGDFGSSKVSEKIANKALLKPNSFEDKYTAVESSINFK
jgi:hypothetical protein